MLEYIILGTIQGVFEWLPISSEGMAALFSHFFIKDFNPVDLALFLHLGTLLAAIFYFRKDWLEIIRLKKKNLLLFLVVVTIISLAVSYPLYHFVKNAVVGNGILLIMGIGLLLTAFFQKKEKKIDIKNKYLVILVGFLQGLAVIPGVSRSGATIFGLSLKKMPPEKILKISYLMSVPVVLASSFYLFLNNPVIITKAWPALIVSFLVGILFLHLLIRWAKKINFFQFALFFSAICFIGAIIGFIL